MPIPSPYYSADNGSSLLWQMLTGYWVSQTLHVAAKLQVVDHLSQHPQTSDELACVLGTDPRASWYLLRALVSVGVVSENENGQFQTTPLGMGLHSATPGSLYSIALLSGDPWVWEAWGNLLYSVQTGETAFPTLTGLEWSAYCEQFPDVGARATQVMTAILQHLYLMALQEYDFSAFHTVVVIGGGQERILTAVLAAAPHLHGVFFDKPDVIAHLSAVSASKDDRDRYVLVGGDVLQSVPIGGDVYLVTQLLQAWDDGQAVTLLHNIQTAMTPGGRVVMLDHLLPAAGNRVPCNPWLGLNTLTILGGCERTGDAVTNLCAQAGLRVTRITPTASVLSIIEAVRESCSQLVDGAG